MDVSRVSVIHYITIYSLFTHTYITVWLYNGCNVFFLPIEIAQKFNSKGIFDEISGKQLIKLGHFSKMESSVTALQTADLTKLDTCDKQLCFFTNLLNLMTIHFHLHAMRSCIQAEVGYSIKVRHILSLQSVYAQL